MGGGLWDYDIEADHLYCNARWYAILGLDPDVSPICSIESFKAHIHPDDVEAATEFDEPKLAALLANDERYSVEFRIIRPTAEIRWLRSVACLIRDSATDHLRAIGCITDITEFRATGQIPFQSAFDQPVQTPGEPEARKQDDFHPTSAPIMQDGCLSSKERECLLWVSLGKTAWETAVIVGRSRRTVEFHLQNAISKLGAVNKIHATAIAIRQGLL